MKNQLLKLNVQPGDLLIVTIPAKKFTPVNSERLRGTIRPLVPEGVKVIIMSDDLKIGAGPSQRAALIETLAGILNAEDLNLLATRIEEKKLESPTPLRGIAET